MKKSEVEKAVATIVNMTNRVWVASVIKRIRPTSGDEAAGVGAASPPCEPSVPLSLEMPASLGEQYGQAAVGLANETPHFEQYVRLDDVIEGA